MKSTLNSYLLEKVGVFDSRTSRQQVGQGSNGKYHLLLVVCLQCSSAYHSEQVPVSVINW